MEAQQAEDNEEIHRLVAQFSKLRYSPSECVDHSIQDKLVEMFLCHFDTVLLQDYTSEPIEAMNFKKIFIRIGSDIYIYCKHKSMRRVLLSLNVFPEFENMYTLKEYDVHTLMKQKPVLILIYGTSGSGKSTMSKRLSALYGIKNVLSTDTVRKKMRTVTTKDENPLLHASTFETGDFLPESDYHRIKECFKANLNDPENSNLDPEILKEMACVKGYEYQCQMIESNLSSEISKICDSGESLIVEGVHLSESVCSQLYKKYEYCIPFMIYVKDAEHHKSRFGSRCEGGSVDPSKNRYVKNFRYIRAIQKAIKQNPIDSKFIKTDNDDAKRTLGLVTTCIRKYIRKLMNLSSTHSHHLIGDRKSNILNNEYKKSVVQIQKEVKDKVIEKKPKKDSKVTSPKDDKMKWIFCRKNKDRSQYWFLKYEKLYHCRTKKYPLTGSFKKRAKSAKKKNKYQSFNQLEIEGLKVSRLNNKHFRTQKSIFEAIRKYGKGSTKSKVSESTACTITKINACSQFTSVNC